MSLVVLRIGVLIFGMGAILSLLSAVRILQTSRRWSDYRLRRRYLLQARLLILLATLSGGLAVVLLILGPERVLHALPSASTATRASAVPGTSDTPRPSNTAPPATDTPTAILVTPSPIVPPTSTITPTPVMPIAVQAMIEGTVTPAFDVEFGRLRFSTEINDYRLVAPGERFRNPIKQIFSVFTYQPVGAKIQWTALWYENGELRYIDTTSWQAYPTGVAVAGWNRPAPEWQPGEYEVQIFVGTDWKASGRFLLEGEPPTATATPRPSATATLRPSATATRTATPTRTATASPLPSQTLTPSPTRTHTPRPTATLRPSATPSRTPTATRTAAAGLLRAATIAASPTRTNTPRPTATLRPSATATPTPTATLTASPTRTNTPRPSATLRPSATPTRTPTPTLTASPTRTNTPRPSATLRPSATATRTPTPTLAASPRPSRTPSRTPSPSPTATSLPVIFDVYFTRTRSAAGLAAPVDAA
ncbi:MAG TPA: hypothetical protein VLL49_11120, partial [Anaerolineales bacterium]|nr:hypothetical protein [Anaerolineales bacterium]